MNESVRRFCVYVDWVASRSDDAVLAQIGTDAIPDDAESETCIYWDEKRPGVLVLTWNLEAASEQQAAASAAEAVAGAVSRLVSGHVGDVTVYADDDDES